MVTSPHQRLAQAKARAVAAEKVVSLNDAKSFRTLAAANTEVSMAMVAVRRADDPEPFRKGDEMVTTMLDRLPRTFLGESNNKGRQSFIIATQAEFDEWKLHHGTHG